MFSDLLILAFLAKFFWDLGKDQLIPLEYFTLFPFLLAFLLGISQRWGKLVLKEGISIAILIIFLGILNLKKVVPLYVGFLGALILTYFFAKLAHSTFLKILALLTLLIFMVIFYKIGK
jgi:hypothetical protein